MSNQENGKFPTVGNFPPKKPEANDKTAEWVNAQHAQLESGARSLVDMAMALGEVLCIVREKNEEGGFLQWLGNSIHIKKTTVYRYMALYNNKEKVSDAKNLTDAYKKIEASMTLKKAQEQEEAEARVAEYNKTGKKPKGWRQHTDDRLAKRMAAQKEEEPGEDGDEAENEEDDEAVDVTPPQKGSPKNDAKRTPLLAKKAEDKPENDPFMEDLLDYLSGQPNDSRRARACKAVIRKCQDILDDCMA